MKSLTSWFIFLTFLIVFLTLLFPRSEENVLQSWIYRDYRVQVAPIKMLDARFHLTGKSNSFLETSNSFTASTTKEFDFFISKGYASPDGVEKEMLLVNNIFPGPTIELNEGDQVIVRVHNNLTEATTMHWHGLFLKSTPFYDGVAGITQCGIPPGESLEYKFELDEWTGTTWYHAHYKSQRIDGLSGAFIVHAKKDLIPAYDGDLVVQLSDIYHSISNVIVEKYLSPFGMVGVPGDEPVPDGGVMNGIGQSQSSKEYFSFNLKPLKTYRIRLINSGAFAPITFSIDHHSLLIVEADGVVIEPYLVQSLIISVGQRYSVLVKMKKELGAFWMRGVIDQKMFLYDNPNFNPLILGILRYGTGRSRIPTTLIKTLENTKEFDEYSLVPAISETPRDPTFTYLVKISSQRTSDGHTLMFFNSTSWEPLVDSFTLGSELGFDTTGPQVVGDQFIVNIPDTEVSHHTRSTVDIIVQNLDSSDHTAHLHLNRVSIVGKGAGKYAGEALNLLPNPMRRDTVVVPAYHWVALRFVASSPGVFSFHCHMSWHMASGLMMQFVNMASVLRQMEIPSVLLDQCKRQ